MAHVNPKCFDLNQLQQQQQKGNSTTTTSTSNTTNSNSQHSNDSSSIAGGSDQQQQKSPNQVSPYCSMWFIGLEFERTENLNVDLTESIQNFTGHVHQHAVSIE